MALDRPSMGGTSVYHAWYSKKHEGRLGSNLWRRESGELVRVTAVQSDRDDSYLQIYPDAVYKGLVAEYAHGYRRQVIPAV